MAIDEHLTEHARGAMIGLAIGDALGHARPQSMSAERIIECYGGPVRRLMDAVPQQPIAPNMKAGSVTDDTEQAFVLATRLIEDHGRIDNDAYAQDLLRWEAKMKEKGSLDLLGPSTKAALQALVEGVDPGAYRTIRHHERRRHARHPGRHRLHSRKRLGRGGLAFLRGDAQHHARHRIDHAGGRRREPSPSRGSEASFRKRWRSWNPSRRAATGRPRRPSSPA